MYEVLDADERTPDGTGLLPEPLRGRVEFRNVDFSYTPEQHLIENLDLVAEPGQTVAIVADRRRQDHPGQPAGALLRNPGRPDPDRRGRHHHRSES